MIRGDLRAYLLSQTTVTDLIGQRIHQARAPQSLDEAQPYISFRRFTGGYIHDLDGGADRAEPLFELDVWGFDPDQVEAVGEAVRLKLQGLSQTNVGPGETYIHEVILMDEKDFYHPAEDGSDGGWHRTQFTYQIGHQVALPNT